MRVKLSKNDLTKLFNAIKIAGLSQEDTTTRLGVSVRTLNFWKKGKVTIPYTAFRSLIRITKAKQEVHSAIFLPDYWHVKEAARKGAYRRMELYGNFGTLEGRKKGGINSLKTHRKNPSGFKTLKYIKPVKKSEKLAELMGILIGDGHLSDYQVSITTNSLTDEKHAIFARRLIKKLFNITPVLKSRKDENTLTLVVSSKRLVKLLNKLGMPTGNKIKNNLAAPKWIFKKQSYKKFFLRGLFDTDGCIYLDIHKNGSKKYKTLGWTITSYAAKLRVDIIKILRELGYFPTYRMSQKSVFLRRKNDIIRYFSDVGTDNSKHYLRYQQFIGRVPKWS